MKKHLIPLLTMIISLMTIFTSNGETKQYVWDIKAEQELPEGWSMGSRLEFKSVNDVNCLYFGSKKTIYNNALTTPVFHKITRIDMEVEKMDRYSAEYTLYFNSLAGTDITSCLYEYTNKERGELIFENSLENPFPDETQSNYSLTIIGDNAYISKITITYEEFPTDDEEIASFIFKNIYGDDNTEPNGMNLKYGNAELNMSGTVKYNQTFHTIDILGDGKITVSAPHIIKVDVSTDRRTEVLIDGEMTKTWQGYSNFVEITPPVDAKSSIMAITVYTKNIEPVDNNLSAIIKDGVPGSFYMINIPLQGVVEGENGILYARTMSDDACTNISTPPAESGDYDDDASSFIQRDWIALDLNSTEYTPDNYVNKCINAGIIGRLNTDIPSPMLEIAMMSSVNPDEEIESRYNTYGIRNFCGDVQHPDAFVVKPQINEYASVTGNIETDANGDGYVLCDDNGKLKLDNSRGVINSSNIGCSATVKGVILIENGNSSNDKTQLPNGNEYIFYVLELSNVTSGTEDINSVKHNQPKVSGLAGTISISGHFSEVEVYDISGKFILSSRQNFIHIPAGCYIIRIKAFDSECIYTEKVIVK